MSSEERKRRRMESNRESARRSRARKQQQLDGLVSEAARLREENGRIAAQIEVMERQLAGVGGENAVLGARAAELTERLRSLGSVLRFVEEFSGLEVEIPEIPDPLMRPWQLPCPAPPIMAASADMLQF